MSNMEEYASFAGMFSNSNAGGKMPKKKSAAARQKAKAKEMKSAAYIALGKNPGKKVKSKGAGKTTGTKPKGTGTSSTPKNKPTKNNKIVGILNNYPAEQKSKVKAAGLNQIANMSLGKQSKSSPSMADQYKQAANIALGTMSRGPVKKSTSSSVRAAEYKQAANIGLGNPRTSQVRAKPTKTNTPPVKPSSGRSNATRGAR